MLTLYGMSAVGIALFGQQSGGGARLLDEALAADPSVSMIMKTAGELAGIGVSPTDAAIIVALSGVGWKLLDVSQKGGTVETLNLWMRRKLKIDTPNPPGV